MCGDTLDPVGVAGAQRAGASQGPPPGYLALQAGLGAVLPALEHVRQLVQAAVVEVEDLVLTLPAGDDQLAAGAGLVAAHR